MQVDGKQSLADNYAYLKSIPQALGDDYQNAEIHSDGVNPAQIPQVYLHPGSAGDGVKPKGKSRASVPVKYNVGKEGVSGISSTDNNANFTTSMPDIGGNAGSKVNKNIRGFGMPVVQEFKDLLANVKKEQEDQKEDEQNYENQLFNSANGIINANAENILTENLPENDDVFYTDTRIDSEPDNPESSNLYEEADSPRMNFEGILGASFRQNNSPSHANSNGKSGGSTAIRDSEFEYEDTINVFNGSDSGTPIHPNTSPKPRKPKTLPKPDKQKGSETQEMGLDPACRPADPSRGVYPRGSPESPTSDQDEIYDEAYSHTNSPTSILQRSTKTLLPIPASGGAEFQETRQGPGGRPTDLSRGTVPQEIGPGVTGRGVHPQESQETQIEDQDLIYEDAYSHTSSPTQILHRSPSANISDGYIDRPGGCPEGEGTEDIYVNEGFHGNTQKEAGVGGIQEYEQMDGWTGDGVHPALRDQSYLQVIP